jgi:hypothetical protein
MNRQSAEVAVARKERRLLKVIQEHAIFTNVLRKRASAFAATVLISPVTAFIPMQIRREYYPIIPRSLTWA